MADETTQSSKTAAAPSAGETGAPPWRAVLEEHSAWKLWTLNQDPPLTVQYDADMVTVEGATQRQATYLWRVVLLVLGSALDYRVTRLQAPGGGFQAKIESN